MGKKKPFIDRHEASHFHVVHRSQRDVHRGGASDDASEFVLLPAQYTSNNKMKKKKNQQQNEAEKTKRNKTIHDLDQVNEDGFVNDGYDYSKHMREIGGGTFYSSSGLFCSQNEDALLKKRHDDVPEEAMAALEAENERMLEAIVLSTDCMDSDLQEALINAEGFEELQDEFVLQASIRAEPDEQDNHDSFDYDAHIAALLGERASKADGIDDEEDFFVDDTDDDTEAPIEIEENDMQLLDEMFERAVAEYDDDQIGYLEDYESETRGRVELEGELLEQVLEDYVSIQQEIYDEAGIVGNPARSGNELDRIRQECQDRMEMEMEMEALLTDGTDGEAPHGEDDDGGGAVGDEDAEEHVSLAFKEYLKLNKKEEWDCESIVSTYSNTDNHPKVIAAPKRNKDRRRTMTIKLSRKTGLPIIDESSKDEHDDENDENDDENDDKNDDKNDKNKQHRSSSSSSRRRRRDQQHGENDEDERNAEDEDEDEEATATRRARGETAEARRDRKQRVKDEKRRRRCEKKATKVAFKHEQHRQNRMDAAQTGGNVSTFRY